MSKKSALQISLLAIMLLLTNSNLFAQKRAHLGKTSKITQGRQYVASGRIAAGAKKVYSYRGRKGQLMTVRITSNNRKVYICETDGDSSDYPLNYTGAQKVEVCNAGRATTFTLNVNIK